jgi:hypothetical protein
VTMPPDLGPELRWKIVNLKVDSVAKLLSVGGLLVAALVAYSNISSQQEQAQRDRKREEEAERHRVALELSISSQPIETDQEHALLIFDIHLKNTGRDTISPYSHKDDPNQDNLQYSGQGCTLSVTEHDLPDEGLVNYWSGRRIVPRFNILEKYDYGRPGSWSDRYRIRPQTSYHETEVVTVKRGRLYEATVRFYGKDMGTITEIQYFFVK